jgi:hypothetical protein
MWEKTMKLEMKFRAVALNAYEAAKVKAAKVTSVIPI